MHGFLFINKPIGITSFGVVARLRRVTGVKKIGHSGTLDPLASGVLICAIGREATRQLDGLLKRDKEYRTTIELGATSTTYDREGEITEVVRRESSDVKRKTGVVKRRPSKKEIESVIKKFVGTVEQLPPVYSAKKIKGVSAYKLARQGKEVVMRPHTVRIDAITIISYKWPQLTIDVACGSGTYIRSLGHDIGQALGVGGYLSALERTAIGSVQLADCKQLDQLSGDNWSTYLHEVVPS